jgi:hypothetical protein
MHPKNVIPGPKKALLGSKNDCRGFISGECFWGRSLSFPGCWCANFARQRRIGRPAATMKFHITKVLRFWVECEFPDYSAQHSSLTKSELIAQILRSFEEAGDAMRYLNAEGRVAWKASPRMLARLADAEREAEDDLADWP